MKLWQAAKITKEVIDNSIYVDLHAVTSIILGIPVIVSIESGCTVIADREINMYGVGNTFRDAVYDYCTMVIQFYADLLSNKDRLGSNLSDDLEYLRSTIHDTGTWTDDYIDGWVDSRYRPLTTDNYTL